MSEEARRLYLGIDVQASRGCPYALLDEHGEPRDAGWLDARPADATKKLAALIGCHEDGHSCRVAVGIDAPRLPLPSPRRWYWDGACRRWRQARPSEGGNGRHSEIVIAAHRIANPQWTPHRQFPDWMQLGFALFAALGARKDVHEVFPSASYALLEDDLSVRIGVRLGDFHRDRKDMLDAYVAAATAREYLQGRGVEVGGGDGLGTIVLPRPLPNPIQEVLRWPAPDAVDGQAR